MTVDGPLPGAHLAPADEVIHDEVTGGDDVAVGTTKVEEGRAQTLSGGNLFFEEVALIEEYNEGLVLEVDVVQDGREQVERLVHPVRAVVLKQNL